MLPVNATVPEGDPPPALQNEEIKKQPMLRSNGFDLSMILGIMGMIVGGIGWAGYMRVGVLSHMSQIDAIIMMAAGGGGISLFIIGIVGSLVSPHAGLLELLMEEKQET